jgi:serine protease Do
LKGVFSGGDKNKIIGILKDVACQIRSGLNGSVSGSGALISDEGLILTCAHVLSGSRIQVIFGEGENKGTYNAKPVFINDRTDVALLKVDGLKKPTKWLTVASGRKMKVPEKIITIGNPSLGGKGIAQNAITEGVISTTQTSKYGQERIVANITIASGSSGSPLIAADTGEIIGVVTAVLGPKLDKDEGFASSGFFCLAAPSTKFKEWIGLESRE